MASNRTTRLWVCLDKPFIPWVFIGLALLLTSRSLTAGLGGDDYIILSQLRGQGTLPKMAQGAHDLFVFAPRTAEGIQTFVEEGVFPWWTDPQTRLARFHPLAGLTHLLDHTLWPDAIWVWHAHSLLWFCFALLAAYLFYRMTAGPGPVAVFALILFALDDAHGPAVGWIAARNTIMAFTFCALALSAHVAWRRKGWRAAAVMGPLLLALGLFSNEMAIGGIGYLLAYSLFLDEGPLWRRISRLWGHGVVVVVFAAIYVGLGYGSGGGTFYLDPLREPLAFLRELCVRLPVLLTAQLFVPWSDLWPVYPIIDPALPWIAWGFAFCSLLAIGVVVSPLLKGKPLARFAALGMVSSAIPVCAGLPADRTLLIVGLGGMLLTAILVDAFVRERAIVFPGARVRVLAGISVAVILVDQVVANLWWLPDRSNTNAFTGSVFERANDSIPKTPDVSEKTVVLVNPPFEPLVLYMAFMRDAMGEPRPGRVRVLSTGGSSVVLTRIDSRTLRIRPDKGFLWNPADRQLRSSRNPLRAGSVVGLSNVDIEITEMTADQRPAEAVFRFRTQLEDSALTWLRWGEHSYVPFKVPAVGEAVQLPAIDLEKLFAPST